MCLSCPRGALPSSACSLGLSSGPSPPCHFWLSHPAFGPYTRTERSLCLVGEGGLASLPPPGTAQDSGGHHHSLAVRLWAE